MPETDRWRCYCWACTTWLRYGFDIGSNSQITHACVFNFVMMIFSQRHSTQASHSLTTNVDYFNLRAHVKIWGEVCVLHRLCIFTRGLWSDLYLLWPLTLSLSPYVIGSWVMLRLSFDIHHARALCFDRELRTVCLKVTGYGCFIFFGIYCCVSVVVGVFSPPEHSGLYVLSCKHSYSFTGWAKY